MQARASPKAFKQEAEALMADTSYTTPGHLPSSMLLCRQARLSQHTLRPWTLKSGTQQWLANSARA